MAIVGTLTETGIAPRDTGHYVDWGAIAAGGLVAFAISSLFIAFGSAAGLSMTSFVGVKSASVTALVVAAALWFLWIQVSGFVAGGYVAGRMRRRIGDATPHEVEMRDGTHGLVAWALAVVMAAVIAGLIALSGLSGAASSNVTDYYVEKMLRSAAPPAGQAATPPTSPSASLPVADTAQIGRVLAHNLGSARMDDADQSYLVNQIIARSGATQAEAQTRLDQTVALLKAQADTSRRIGILAAFLTAASLLLGAVAAWWAATTGGRHRNEAVDHSRFTRWH
jgi:hypothetical protein